MITNRFIHQPKLMISILVLAIFFAGCQDAPPVLPTDPVEGTIPTQESADTTRFPPTPTAGTPDLVDNSIPTQDNVKPTEFPPGFPTPDAEIYAACLEKGGRWEVLGFSGPGCNLPTTDGGKPCREITDCESACLGDLELLSNEDGSGKFLTDQEKVEALNALEGEKVGICSSWQQNFGCRIWLMDGRFVEMCVD